MNKSDSEQSNYHMIKFKNETHLKVDTGYGMKIWTFQPKKKIEVDIHDLVWDGYNFDLLNMNLPEGTLVDLLFPNGEQAKFVNRNLFVEV